MFLLFTLTRFILAAATYTALYYIAIALMYYLNKNSKK